ncbi:MAG TPA: ABC transporter permease [Bryobacteraceae bacterium]
MKWSNFKYLLPWRRRAEERDIQEELRALKQMAEPGELGSLTLAAENARETWGWTPIENMFADVRYAFRTFRRQRTFYSLVISILALGIALSVAVFSLVDGILIRPLPYRDPQQLTMLTSYANKPPFSSNGSLSYNDYLQFRAKAHSFSDLAVTFRTGWSRVTLNAETDPLPLQGAFISPNLFAMFGRSPLLGRTFTAEENSRAERLVVISEGLWRQHFGSSPQAIGQDLVIGRDRWKVIGVMPDDFQIPFLDTQLWAPVLSHPDWHGTEETNPLERQRWDVMARLKPGVTLAAAQSEVDSIERGLKNALPEFHTDEVRVVPLREHFTGKIERQLLVLFAAVSFLLLIACANAANLLLARASQREREFAIRTSLGAGHARILRQLVIESLTFSCAGGVAGAALAFALVPLLKAGAPPNIPLLDSVTMNERGLVLALLLSVTIGVLLGMAPAWQALRCRVNDSLKAAERNATESRAGRHFKSFLITAEFAVAMTLLTGAGLLIRSFVAVLSVNPGFHAERVLTVRIALPGNTPPQKAAQFYRDASERIAALPGVQAVGGISNLFFLDETRTHALREAEGHAPEPESAWTPLVWAQISGDYFQAMGIPLLRGRVFRDSDNPESPVVAIINQTLAERYWPHANPIGKRLKGFDPRGKHDDWLTVVGVVKDTRSGGLEKEPFSQIYEPQSQRGDQIGSLVVRTAAEPEALAASVRKLLRNLNHGVAVSLVATMEQLLERQELQRRFQTWLITVFSSLALALAAFGVFAVMHYSVAARSHEIGIRMALGANSRDIARLILGNGTRLAIGGIFAGSVAALALTRWIAGMLYNVNPLDPVSFFVAALSLWLAALLASFLPARAATQVDPTSAMRQE